MDDAREEAISKTYRVTRRIGEEMAFRDHLDNPEFRRFLRGLDVFAAEIRERGDRVSMDVSIASSGSASGPIFKTERTAQVCLNLTWEKKDSKQPIVEPMECTPAQLNPFRWVVPYGDEFDAENEARTAALASALWSIDHITPQHVTRIVGRPGEDKAPLHKPLEQGLGWVATAVESDAESPRITVVAHGGGLAKNPRRSAATHTLILCATITVDPTTQQIITSGTACPRRVDWKPFRVTSERIPYPGE